MALTITANAYDYTMSWDEYASQQSKWISAADKNMLALHI